MTAPTVADLAEAEVKAERAAWLFARTTDERRSLLCWLSGYDPVAFDRARTWLERTQAERAARLEASGANSL
jgi:hypothetical protein